jgi:hypothetical protein
LKIFFRAPSPCYHFIEKRNKNNPYNYGIQKEVKINIIITKEVNNTIPIVIEIKKELEVPNAI